MTAAGEVTRERTYSWVDPTVYTDAAQGRSGLELFQHLLEIDCPPPPIGQTLGFRLVEVDKGLAVFAIEPAEYLYNPIGSVHGGVYATLLDSAAGCAVPLSPTTTPYASAVATSTTPTPSVRGGRPSRTRRGRPTGPAWTTSRRPRPLPSWLKPASR